VVIVLVLLSLAIALPFSLNTQTVWAQDDSYSIQSVEHEVEVLYSGHVIISDTIHVTGQLEGDFLIGFPYKYGSSVLKGIAYNAENVFPVSLGVQLADRSGFYGAKISFPQGAPQEFTIVFFLSNDLLSSRPNGFALDFPAYPAFVKDAAQCNVRLVLPEVAGILNITKNDGTIYTNSFSTENLNAFTYSPAIAIFNVPEVWIRLINISTLNRKIAIGPAGNLEVFDSYRITNNSPDTLSSLKFVVPVDATNIVARDESSRILTTNVLPSEGDTRPINITLTSSLTSGQSTLLTTEYNLPSASSEQISRFTLIFSLFADFNYYIDSATITFVLPEGARFIAPQIESIGPSSSLIREVFQETLIIRREGVSKKEYDVPSEGILQIAYNYNPLWLSFRPTLWMLTIVVVGAVVIFVWRRPKTAAPTRMATAKASIGLSPDHVRAFTEAYNEKTRIGLDLKALATRAQKGRISRRRYKVQKRTLEVRLDNISRNIADLKRSFRSAGGVYANLIQQLDIAETELVKIESDSRNSEVRHKRGELPLEAYKKALVDHQRRKEKIETTINGILLRLREEIR
jgi:hypothetical protein